MQGLIPDEQQKPERQELQQGLSDQPPDDAHGNGFAPAANGLTSGCFGMTS